VIKKGRRLVTRERERGAAGIIERGVGSGEGGLERKG